MRVLVTGGTMFRDRAWLWAALDLLHEKGPIIFIIEGGAPGADGFAWEWRRARGVEGHTEEAEWERLGLAAGPIRNTKMAKMQPDVVLVTPGSKGTRSMTEIATAHGLRIIYLEKMPVSRTMEAPLIGAPPPIIVDAA